MKKSRDQDVSLCWVLPFSWSIKRKALQPCEEVCTEEDPRIPDQLVAEVLQASHHLYHAVTFVYENGQ